MFLVVCRSESLLLSLSFSKEVFFRLETNRACLEEKLGNYRALLQERFADCGISLEKSLDATKLLQETFGRLLMFFL